MNRYLVSAQAETDLEDHALYIGHDRPSSARAFIDAAIYTFEQLAAHPKIGMSYKASSAAFPEMRRFPVKGFDPYLIFYVVAPAGIYIVRVIHAARDIAELFKNDDSPKI